MYRSHTCGELTMEHVGQEVTLAGWMYKNRDLGGMTFIDIRDRYGRTQLVFNMDDDAALCEKARKLNREFVIQATGLVRERSNKNSQISTGDVEIQVNGLTVLNKSKLPPFTIEDDTDGGEDLRMAYRYLDLRRGSVQKNIIFRSKLALESRNYLSSQNFIEVETPFLIKSTPEGARDFVVPSRMNKGLFYALPQSPQTFKQLLMVSGFDRYFQIVKCFRDEDLRADRQPEFTQIDCEMAFIHQDDVLHTFEGLTRHVFKALINVEFDEFPRMTYDEALELYGSDKPDIRFGMTFVDFTELAKGKGFAIFDQAETIIGINASGAAGFTRKQLDQLTDFVKKPQIGAKGLIYARCNEDGTFKSSVDKFFNQDDLTAWADKSIAKAGDLILILAGEKEKTRKQLSELRLHMGTQLGLRDPKVFKPLWVVDFPLLEWDEKSGRFHAMHHPFTSPKKDDVARMLTGDHESMKSLRADAYDLVINGAEIGGGSIRIHDRTLQSRNFDLLGFSKEEAEDQFGFLMGAFEYGAPPHGGIAFGFDRLCAVMNGQESIRDFIAFPKNNMGRDVMIDAPSKIHTEQLDELGLELKKSK